MFETVHREMREWRSAERLPQLLPQLVYVILAPFMGPEAAGEFVSSRRRHV